MSGDVRIVEAEPGHAAAVASLHRTAFDGDFEAALVKRLQRDGLVAASLVALHGREVVGHILFRGLAAEIDGRPVAAAAPAPIAVRLDRQRQGIGTRLVAEGLTRVRQCGRAAVIVLGHPGYDRRFGFAAALAAKLASPLPGDALMALELVPGALAGHSGSVRYPPAFELG